MIKKLNSNDLLIAASTIALFIVSVVSLVQLQDRDNTIKQMREIESEDIRLLQEELAKYTIDLQQCRQRSARLGQRAHAAEGYIVRKLKLPEGFFSSIVTGPTEQVKN